MDIKGLVGVIGETDKLKSVYRKAYLTDMSRHENSAEHSWHLCIALFALKPYMPDGLDIDHAIRMALMHDVCEIGAGDTSVYSKDRDKKHVAEASYMKVFSEKHGAVGDLAETCWREYEEQESLESQWVKVVDRLLPFIMNILTAGKCWVDQNISKDQVLKVNQPIADHFPELFQWMEAEIENAVIAGWLKG